jgi:hypothetical protein
MERGAIERLAPFLALIARRPCLEGGPQGLLGAAQ